MELTTHLHLAEVLGYTRSYILNSIIMHSLNIFTMIKKLSSEGYVSGGVYKTTPGVRFLFDALRRV
jgi:hypothetical protein